MATQTEEMNFFSMSLRDLKVGMSSAAEAGGRTARVTARARPPCSELGRVIACAPLPEREGRNTCGDGGPSTHHSTRQDEGSTGGDRVKGKDSGPAPKRGAGPVHGPRQELNLILDLRTRSCAA